MRSTFMGLMVAAAVACFCGVGLAQNAPRSAALPPGEAARGESSQSDQQIAAVLFTCGHNEITIAKFAQPKLQTEQARQFAEKMTRDHQPSCEVYQRLAGNLVGAVPAAVPGAGPDAAPGAPRREEGLRPGAAAAPPPAGELGGRPGGTLDWVSIHKQIGAQCLQSVQQELASKSGGEFDKCFIGQQIGAHMMAVDELKVLRNYAGGELRQQIDKDLQVATDHLQEAKQIMEQLKDLPTERVSRNPAQPAPVNPKQ